MHNAPTSSKPTDNEPNRLARILDSVPAFIGMVDADQRYEFVNSMYVTSYGKPRNEIIGSTVREINGKREYEKSKSKIESVLDGNDVEFEYDMSGTHFLINYLPRMDNGVVTGYFVISSNVTQLKKTTEELNTSKKALQNALSQFDSLSNFAHENRIASLGIMASSLAHEITQPLTAIGGLAFLLQQALDGNFEEKSPTSIIRNIDRQLLYANQLVERLRRFVSNKETTRTQTNLNDVVHESLALLAPRLRGKSIELSLALAGTLDDVNADPIEIQQVLVNLITNAIESLMSQAADSRVIRISTKMDPPNVLVLIEDNGPGIPEELRSKLFEAFQSGKQTGLGIGLALSRSLIESHMGTLTFDNSTHRGWATFRVSLPSTLSL